MEKMFEELKNLGLTAGIKVAEALLILVIGFRIVKWIEKMLKTGKALKKLDANVRSFLISFISVALKVLVLICVASVIGIPMTSIITLVGSFSLAVGLALQGGLSNLAGGIMILIFKPFVSGDYIKASDNEGTVHGITLFYTILTTIDNKRIMLPNGELSNMAITNYTTLKKRRLDVNFEVGYDSDIGKVKNVLNEVINKQINVLKDEDIFVRLTEQGESSLVFTVRVWVQQDDYWSTKFDILEQVKEAFDKNKIEIPYKQIDVHMKEK